MRASRLWPGRSEIRRICPRFFSAFPGFARTEPMEEELAGRSLVTFSTDVTADDWYHIGPGQIVSRAISRLEARGKASCCCMTSISTRPPRLPGSSRN